MTVVQELNANVVKMPQVLGKTEQRVRAVLDCLQANPSKAFTYADLTQETSMPYDALLYVLHTLVELNVVQRNEVIEGPGRPRVTFTWAPRATGARKANRA